MVAEGRGGAPEAPIYDLDFSALARGDAERMLRWWVKHNW